MTTEYNKTITYNKINPMARKCLGVAVMTIFLFLSYYYFLFVFVYV